MKNDLNVINLFGGPSIGKSTQAAGLFYEMKKQGYNVELVTEYAKELVWENRTKTFEDQLYITIKQHHRIQNLIGQVDYVITDSPILLGIMYLPKRYFSNAKPLILELFNSYENYNYLLEGTHKFEPNGRIHTEDESIELTKKITNTMIIEDIDFSILPANESLLNTILGQIN